jgi:hypothetical protein
VAARPTTIPQVCAAFWQIEQELSLAELRAGDVPLWPLLRLHLYYEATRALGLFDQPVRPAQGLGDRAGQALRTLGAALFQGTAWQRRPAPDVVLPHPRKLATAAGPRDVYSARLVDELPRGTTLLIERTPGATAGHRSARRDLLDLGAWLEMRLSRRRLPPEATAALARAAAAFAQALGVALPIGALARRSWLKALAQRRRFARLFRRLGTRRVFLVVGYTNEGIVLGARDAGAAVIELQHGTITPFHLAYSWPGRPALPTSPDRLLTYGTFWTDSVALPASVTPLVIGASHFEETRRALAAIQRKPRQALFVSQGVIGHRLAAVALDVARLAPDWQVVFRLHPGEERGRFAAELAARAGAPPANFSLSAGAPGIFPLLAESAVQIGVFSTALIEGMALGGRTLLLPLPGIDYMAPILARGDALLVADAAACAAHLDRAPLAADPAVYFAPPVPSILTALASA